MHGGPFLLTDELYTAQDVEPLVITTQLERAVVNVIQDEVVIALQQMIIELEETQTLVPLQTLLCPFRGQA